MGDIEWAVRSFGLSIINETTMWIMAIILVVVILNMILEVFNDNDK